ncbi:PLP-dependent aminotransferase family protein [Streptoalloteichus hindustanus]|uniref:Histidine decarboxylase n=1 Tax=Streptoalloteichus hindustanus TaxID=2017 RepID=A0A1M4ZH56_STRHI|nr:hypothetical protein [Streptoalloteichus hindustanus]SHF17373.1 histidine decarboxylase [Streptoalloteichus hindustanus]
MSTVEDRSASVLAHSLRHGLRLGDNPFVLPAGGVDDGRRRAILTTLTDHFAAKLRVLQGSRSDRGVDYQADLGVLLNFPFAYIGDPFEESDFAPYLKAVEREVVDYFARLWHAGPRSDDVTDKDAYWGYVLTMGSSEGILYALWAARDHLSGKSLVSDVDDHGSPVWMWVQDTPPDGAENAYSPVAFHSADSHYSISKALRVLGIPTFYEVGSERYPEANPLAPGQPWPTEAPCQGGAFGSGRVDVGKLVALVEFFAGKGHPILLVLNYFTSFKGAYDDVEEICARLRPVFARHGLDRRAVRHGLDANGGDLTDERTGYWVHVDGAMGGMSAAFLRRAAEQGRAVERDADGRPLRFPRFDFEVPEVCSIVSSGHKYTESPWPSGILLTKRGLHMTPHCQPDATSVGDTTFGGSRSALVPIALWDFLASNSEQDQVDQAVHVWERAREVERTLRELGPEWDVRRNAWSPMVWFRKPPQEIVNECWLLTAELREAAETREYACFNAAMHTGPERLARLVERMAQATPEPPRSNAPNAPARRADGHGPVRRLAMVPLHRRCL